ncbi:MAG: hypothetical protein ACXWAC_10820 [Usitatibacter sp.]
MHWCSRWRNPSALSDLKEVGIVEQWPKLEGRQMIMILGPKKKH